MDLRQVFFPLKLLHFSCHFFPINVFHVDLFQSTGSFFRDRSITLGSLMGVSSILELSRRSMRGRPSENPRGKKNCKSKPWLFSLCSKLNTDAVSMSNNGTPSLGHFLESERRAATTYRRNPGPLAYGPDDFSQGNALQTDVICAHTFACW